jgi:hypothetical protein
MTTWGVLRLPDEAMSSTFTTGDGAVGAALAAHVDGAVALAHDAPLGTALSSLPEHVTVVVELDADDAATGEPGALIAALLGALESCDARIAAVVAARPMADALKRIDGDIVVEGLARDGLLTPCLPHVYRRATLATVLAGVQDPVDGPAVDPVALLLDAGHAVMMLPAGADPIVVRSR